MSQQQVNVYPLSQAMPYWNASNAIWTEEVIPLKILAFLPVLPYPVTEYTTVYHDKFRSTDEFCNIVPMMGTFHLVKTVHKCIGKYRGGVGLT